MKKTTTETPQQLSPWMHTLLLGVAEAMADYHHKRQSQAIKAGIARRKRRAAR